MQSLWQLWRQRRGEATIANNSVIGLPLKLSIFYPRPSSEGEKWDKKRSRLCKKGNIFGDKKQMNVNNLDLHRLQWEATVTAWNIHICVICNCRFDAEWVCMMCTTWCVECIVNSWVGGSVTREGGQSVHCYCCCSAMELRVTGCSLLRVAKDTRTPRTIMWIVPAPKHFQEHALFRWNIVDWIQFLLCDLQGGASRREAGLAQTVSHNCTNSLVALFQSGNIPHRLRPHLHSHLHVQLGVTCMLSRGAVMSSVARGVLDGRLYIG